MYCRPSRKDAEKVEKVTRRDQLDYSPFALRNSHDKNGERVDVEYGGLDTKYVKRSLRVTYDEYIKKEEGKTKYHWGQLSEESKGFQVCISVTRNMEPFLGDTVVYQISVVSRSEFETIALAAFNPGYFTLLSSHSSSV